MSNADQTYADALRFVIYNGIKREDRTGVGTTSYFGYSMNFDLRSEFPILEGKKIHWPSVAHELLWMISGSTNVSYLNENGVTIWDEWADENGDLGPVYGWNWRRWGEQYVPRQRLADGVPATYLGVGNGKGKNGHPLGKTWEGMMSRCYDTNNPSYPTYGGAGVQVCSRWLQFENFAADAVNLPGYRDGRRTEDGERLVLDKDQRGQGKLYSPESCMWLTDKENVNLNHHRTFIVENENGDQFSFRSATEFGNRMGFDPSNFSDLWTGNKNAVWRNGYRLVSIQEDDTHGIDQLAEAIRLIKEDPTSRRIIVNAWNVADLDEMALPPCHMFYQFYVDGDYLDVQVYQRSADIFLGVPFNISSYALLLSLVAHVTGKTPRFLRMVFGDLHLYNNHQEAAAKYLDQVEKVDIYSRPMLVIATDQDDIDRITYEDFALTDYYPQPTIKAPVAV